MTPRYIEFVDDLPRTPTGKIQKRALRTDLITPATWDRVEAGVEVPR
jgi:crotonobetaine/carnitine-CoA ligase